MDKQLEPFPGAVALGRQMTIEFYDCGADVLSDAEKMESIFLEACRVSGAHVINSNFHSFEPQGVSGVVVISESHFAVHAWPEHDYAAVDLFTCGNGVDFNKAVEYLGNAMRSGQWIISSLMNRGILHDSGRVERLEPVVENGVSGTLQLSWKERFDHTGARAISASVDLYGLCCIDFDSPEEWKIFAAELGKKLDGESGHHGQWIWLPREQGAEFLQLTSHGRISGFAVPEEKTLYLNIFADGFFDPRNIAEFAMEYLKGTYYRMQVQIRQ